MFFRTSLSKVTCERNCKNRTCSNRESLFRKKKNCKSFRDTHARFLSKVLSKATFKRKLSSVSTTLRHSGWLARATEGPHMQIYVYPRAAWDILPLLSDARASPHFGRYLLHSWWQQRLWFSNVYTVCSTSLLTYHKHMPQKECELTIFESSAFNRLVSDSGCSWLIEIY